MSLAQSGASLVDIQTAGRWKDPGMPAHYARAQFAERGAIARFKDSTGEITQLRSGSFLGFVHVERSEAALLVINLVNIGWIIVLLRDLHLSLPYW